jgi:hypothetical protein
MHSRLVGLAASAPGQPGSSWENKAHAIPVTVRTGTYQMMAAFKNKILFKCVMVSEPYKYTQYSKQVMTGLPYNKIPFFETLIALKVK